MLITYIILNVMYYHGLVYEDNWPNRYILPLLYVFHRIWYSFQINTIDLSYSEN